MCLSLPDMFYKLLQHTKQFWVGIYQFFLMSCLT